MCWHSEPLKRLTFEEIVSRVEAVSKREAAWKEYMAAKRKCGRAELEEQMAKRKWEADHRTMAEFSSRDSVPGDFPVDGTSPWDP